MATWRRRDLERRSGARSRTLSRVFRADTLLPIVALVLAGAALSQALAAQSRAALIAHDLGVATARLRGLESYGPPAAPAALTPPTPVLQP